MWAACDQVFEEMAFCRRFIEMECKRIVRASKVPDCITAQGTDTQIQFSSCFW